VESRIRHYPRVSEREADQQGAEGQDQQEAQEEEEAQEGQEAQEEKEAQGQAMQGPEARPDYAAHARAVRASLPEVVDSLRSILGAQLCAYIGSVKETRAVNDRAEGVRDPSGPHRDADRLGSSPIPLPKPPQIGPYPRISAIALRRRIWLARAISASLSLPPGRASGARGRKFESCRARSAALQRRAALHTGVGPVDGAAEELQRRRRDARGGHNPPGKRPYPRGWSPNRHVRLHPAHGLLEPFLALPQLPRPRDRTRRTGRDRHVVAC